MIYVNLYFLQQNNFFFSDLSSPTNASIVVAGTDELSEGTWQDFNGNVLSPQPPFGTNEPNGLNVENCLAVWQTVADGLVDAPCEWIFSHALCEATSKPKDTIYSYI